MKKSLIALAALSAVSGVASAQSSVTLYGIVDLAVERQKGGTSSINKLSSGQLSGSRFGLRGVEDLGDGLKANFTLEAGVQIDEGVTQQSNSTGTTSPVTATTQRLFGRQAWVGLEGEFGAVRLGRQYSPLGLVGDLVGVGDYSALKNSGAIAMNNAFYRNDNAVTYISPKIAGLTITGQYSFGVNGEAPVGVTTEDGGKNFGLNAIYAQGPLTLAAGYLQITDVNYAVANDQRRRAGAVVAAYDFGVAKVTAYANVEGKGDARMKLAGTKVSIPLSSEFTLSPAYTVVRQALGSTAAASDNVNFFELSGVYTLSKRTVIYSNFTSISNGNGVYLRLSSPGTPTTGTNGKSTNGIALGVRHSF